MVSWVLHVWLAIIDRFFRSDPFPIFASNVPLSPQQYIDLEPTYYNGREESNPDNEALHAHQDAFTGDQWLDVAVATPNGKFDIELSDELMRELGELTATILPVL